MTKTIKQQIITLLRKHPEGLTSRQVTKEMEIIYGKLAKGYSYNTILNRMVLMAPLDRIAGDKPRSGCVYKLPTPKPPKPSYRANTVVRVLWGKYEGKVGLIRSTGGKWLDVVLYDSKTGRRVRTVNNTWFTRNALQFAPDAIVRIPVFMYSSPFICVVGSAGAYIGMTYYPAKHFEKAFKALFNK